MRLSPVLQFLHLFHRNPNPPKPPIEIGDLVWTQFFRNEARLPRRVTALRPAPGRCNSGWWVEVESVDGEGHVLACDSSWFITPLGGRMPAVSAN
jgi:hypothetical protein